MAKKKKGKRRRSVGGLSLSKKGTGLKLLALAGGYLLADKLNEQIDKFLPKTKDATTNVEVPNQTIGIVGQVGLGGLLLMSKKESMIKTIAGGVLAGSGLKRALKTAGVIKGYQSVPVIGRPRPRMNGYQQVPVIGKTVVPPQLAGRPAQLQGHRVNGYNSQGSGVLAGYGCGDNGSGSGITQSSVSGYMG